MLEFPFDPDSLFPNATIARDRRALRERWLADGRHDAATLPGMLAESARVRPDLQIVLHSHEHPADLTLESLQRDALAMASAFATRGIGRGDVVAVQLPNWAETAIAYLALATLGAVFVPIVHIYGPRETDWILSASGARMLLCPDRWGTIDFLDRLARMPTIATLDVVIVGDKIPPGATAWSEVAEQSEPDFEPPTLEATDPLLVVYTSGTTSEPKGVVHTHQTFLAELRDMTQMPMGDDELIALHPWPAGHIGGLCSLLGPIVTHSRVVMVDQWDPEDAANRIAEHGVTMVAGTPFHLNGLLDIAERGDPRFATVREALSGGAGVPPSLVERAARSGWSMRRSYGSSEHPTVSAGTRFGPLEPRARTDGAICRGSEVRIVDEAGHDVVQGEEGEIWVIGPEQFIGYTDPARNGEAFAEGGWFRTGDVGILDTAGNLTITDRLKDIIIRGGENLSSLEIEDLLQRHPAVAEAAAVGYPDPRYGERVCAFIIPAEGAAAPSVTELLAHVVELGAAKQKAPERVIELSEFPRTPAGKVKKNQLRKQVDSA